MNRRDYDIPENLQLRTAEIIEMGGLRCTVKLDPAKLQDLLEQGETMTETKLRLDILVGTGDLYAEGTVTCRKKLRCARCLKDMEVRFSGEFQETFSPEAEFIDIMNIVRETAMLSQEPRYVCDESCKGLCPICGANLNEKECGCVRKTAPSPFDVLKEKYGSNSH